MGYLAAKTETIEIGSAILNIYSRTPGALLQTAAGLDNVSGGRAILGLGASGPAGDRGLPRRALRQAARPHRARSIDIVRRGLKREPLDQRRHLQAAAAQADGAVTGLGKPLKILTHPERDTIPIYIAALGPKNVEQGARSIADGWLPHPLHARERRTWSGATRSPPARPSARPTSARSRSPPAAWSRSARARRPRRCSTSPARSSRSTSAAWAPGARTSTTTSPAHYGYEKEAEEIQDLYLDGKKKEAEAIVPIEWLEAGNLVGPASYVQERIAAFREAGVTNLSLSPATDDPAATIAQVKEWVS